MDFSWSPPAQPRLCWHVNQLVYCEEQLVAVGSGCSRLTLLAEAGQLPQNEDDEKATSPQALNLTVPLMKVGSFLSTVCVNRQTVGALLPLSLSLLLTLSSLSCSKLLLFHYKVDGHVLLEAVGWIWRQTGWQIN